jgi:acyl-CoA thioesterase
MPDSPDFAWLSLEAHGNGNYSFELTSTLTRHDGKLFGGTGIAVMVATMEAATERDALWTTVQYASSADLGSRIDCQVDVLAHGKRTSQLRMTATVDDNVILAALGATAVPREGPIEAQIPKMPVVAPPEDCESWERMHRIPDAEHAPSWIQLAEMRHVGESSSIWARMRSGLSTRATMAFLADMVPSSVARAAGRMGGGTSLDNSVRFGRFVESEWILLDMDPWFGTGGYLTGAARVWSQDGVLLGVASQTSSAIVWDGEMPPWVEANR